MSEEADRKEKRLTTSTLRRVTLGTQFTDSVDEAPEFHNPYSELNLFLSQKIKQEMRHCSNSKKWSVKLQDELIHKITPEFEKRFPHYRLGLSALKKTWEKVSYYSEQMQEQKEALTQDGKLNIPFLIKENLRRFSSAKNTCQLHPYHYAHQLALKMSECIAIIDGAHPKVDQLTQAIWSIHRHLIPKLDPEQLKTPYDDYDKIDKLIVKKILEFTAQNPRISQNDLSFCLRQFFKHLSQLLHAFTTKEIQQLAVVLQAIKTGIFSQEPLFEKLSFPLAQLIETEIASILIDSPKKLPSEVAQTVGEVFEKIRALKVEEWAESALESKIQTWAQQSDLLCRWIRLHGQGPLFELITKKWTRQNLESTMVEIVKEYIGEYPSLAFYAKLIMERVWTWLKYLWYTQYPYPEASTFDRFLSWHGMILKEQCPESSPEETISNLRLLCQRMLPLVPFDIDRAFTVLYPKETK